MQDSGPQQSEVTPENLLTVAKDPGYARYLKMLQVGVPVTAIRNKMVSEGLDPDFPERPDDPVPDGEGEKNTEESCDWKKYVLPLPKDRQEKNRQLCDLSKILNRMYSQGSFLKISLIFWLHELRVTL